jgi:hypothetical protein
LQHNLQKIVRLSSDRRYTVPMMAELLARAREQSEHSELSVRAAAWLYIARVERSFDADAAYWTFRRGLGVVQQMVGDDRQLFLQLARNVAAAMDPGLLTEIPAEEGGPPFGRDHLIATMVAQGHLDAAYAYVLNSDDDAFPFIGLTILMHALKKEGDRVAVFRRAAVAWRNRRADPHGDFFRSMGRDRFIELFQWRWTLLPAAEAREIAREIVRSALDEPDHPMNSQCEGPSISSKRENSLFEILHVLQHLDPPLADSLIADHAQLAAITLRYPNGLETVGQEAEEQQKKASRQSSDSEDGVGGDPRDFPFQRALVAASRDGDFKPAMEHALEKYREDTGPENPNYAPKEFWASTSRLRKLFYRAGKKLETKATAYLKMVPDDELRLFAGIELAGALAGVAELWTTSQVHRQRNAALPKEKNEPVISRVTGSSCELAPKGEPMRSPDGLAIRCPKCKWTPGAETRWGCKCGHVWNTFLTHGLCPACQYRWTITACYQCGGNSPHSEWYNQN